MKMQFIRQLILTLTIISFVSCINKVKETPVPDSRPEILKKLDGTWLVTGQVQGDSVAYNLSVKPVLNNTFSELHMKDVSVPPQYEAIVFIGYDTAGKKIISHWMDSFGPAFSIPHGTGMIGQDRIEFIIPYEGNPFRDILTYNEKENSWSFIIESSQDSITWSNFASYKFTDVNAF